MFTVKYQTYQMAAAQQTGSPIHYDRCEQIHGPFGLVSQEMKDGYTVVYAHRGDEPGMTFGPILDPDVAGHEMPRPTLWVMNESGATVATYRL